MNEKDLFEYVTHDKMNNEEKIEYVYTQIIKGNYTVLPDEISTGLVFKIPYEGELDIDGYETSFLYIPKGVGIKNHKHINDIEKYTVIKGTLRVRGKRMKTNRCFIGKEHNINKTDRVTIVETCKISKDYIVELENREIKKRRSLKNESINRTRTN